jgi:hypothetical protein
MIIIAILLAIIASTLLFGSFFTLIVLGVLGAVGAVLVLIEAFRRWPANVGAGVFWVLCAAFVVGTYVHLGGFPWQIH